MMKANVAATRGQARARRAGLAALIGMMLASSAEAVTYVHSSGSYTGPATLKSPDILRLATNADKSFGTFTNQSGTVRLEGGRAIVANGGGGVTNRSLWETVAAATIMTVGSGKFVNSGTLLKSGSGALTVSGTFDNSGGTIQATGGTIDFTGGSTFRTGTVFKAGGTAIQVSAASTFEGAIAFDFTTLAGQAVFGGSDARASGVLLFNAGTLAGTWTIATDGILRAYATTGTTIDGAIANYGSAEWANGGGLTLASSGVVSNYATWRHAGALSGAGRFINYGTFILPLNGTQTIAAAFTNSGTMQGGSGPLVLSGNLTVTDGASFTGSGGMSVTGASNSFSGAFTSANLSLAGANSTYSGANAVLEGTAGFFAGTLTGGWTIDTGATLTVSGSGTKSLSALDMTNKGTLGLAGATTLAFVNNSRLTNAGRILVGNSTSAASSGAGLIVNQASGEIARTVVGSTIITTAFRNEGGLLTATTGGLTLSNTNVRFENGSRVVGGANGGVRLTGGGTFVGTTTSTANGLTLAAASSNTGGSTVYTGTMAALNGPVTWEAGVLDGNWSVASGATLSATGATVKRIRGTVSNAGTLTIGSNVAINLIDLGSLSNDGKISLSDGSSIGRIATGSAAFINNGLIEKTSGTGTATIATGVAFDNRGTIDVRSGTIALPAVSGGFVNNGVLTGTGTVAASGGLINADVIRPGVDGIGTLTLAGPLTLGSSGQLDIQLSSGGLSDLVAVSGAATLDGRLNLSCVICAFSVGDEFKVLTATGGLSGSIATIDKTALGLQPDWGVRMRYDYTEQSAYVQIYQYIFGVPEPSTWAMMIAGFGLVGGTLRRDRRRLRAA